METKRTVKKYDIQISPAYCIRNMLEIKNLIDTVLAYGIICINLIECFIIYIFLFDYIVYLYYLSILNFQLEFTTLHLYFLLL